MTTTTPPTPTPTSHALDSQRLHALQRANVRRGQLAEIRARISRGELTAVDLIADPPAVLAGEMVWKVLIRVPAIGQVKLGELNDEAIRARVNLAAPLGMLSTRQRAWLCNQLKGR